MPGVGVGMRPGSPFSASPRPGGLAVLMVGVGQCLWAFLLVLQVQQRAGPQAKHSLF